MKKYSFIIFIIIILAGYYYWQINQYSTKKSIALLQTASHPTLDLIRETIEKKLSLSDMSITVFNGQGNIFNLNLLASSILDNTNIIGAVAVGSPALLALTTYGAKKSIRLPLWYCAVSYPEQCAIDNYRGHIYGLSDKVGIDTLTQNIHNIAKNKKIGFLYCYNDLGSTTLLNQLEQKMPIYPIGITQEIELADATELLFSKTDLIIIPTDNMIASGFETILLINKKYQKELFMMDKILYNRGGTYWYGIDYQDQADQLSQNIIHHFAQK